MKLPALLLLALLAQFAQADVGELHVIAVDQQAGVLPGATVIIESEASQTRRSIDTGTDGVVTAKRLPFGVYRVTVSLAGFQTARAIVEIRAASPIEQRITLAIAGPAITIEKTADATALDARQTTTVRYLGAETIQQRSATVPGRALPELINTQPGWLLEAGGSVHPRGSENQTQYVVDGLPLTDNRSPGFAPALDADSMRSLGILTGGYPAEYGRKLGGVIEVATIGDPPRGAHGEASVGAGTFGTWGAAATAGYVGERASIAASGSASATDRYLDPPVEENFTNEGRASQATLRAEFHGFGAMISRGDVRFLVPNETEQQEAGQRQVRTSRETAAKLSYQRVVSTAAVFSVNGMLRDLDAGLESNAAATPIFAEQQRGVRDGYARATLACVAGPHQWKAGADTSIGRLHERFAYRITDRSAFDDEILPAFDFSGGSDDREYAAFVQDQIAAGPWTLKAGLRWDAYRLLVNESAWSPRLAVAWSPGPGFVLRASYDRAFQTPAIENLLLASSAQVETLAPSVIRLPVRPSRGNFFEVAGSKVLFGALRMDASWFDRRMSNFADDDLLLNTGVSFPIAFERGFVHGAEVKLEVPAAHRISGFASYGWMRGEAELPVTGGLFLGDEVTLGTPGERVTITQDQRHTLRGRVTARLRPGAWVAFGGAFDSGLPFEDDLAGESMHDVPPRVLERVNLESGRVRPAFTLDASAGWVVKKTTRARIELQADVRNLANALRVINFAGVFSGTALAAPRACAARVRVEF